MKSDILNIKDLHANIDDKEILKGLNLSIGSGEIHVVMGPNGSGKSTLANVLMGNPAYEVTKGDMFFLGEDLTEMEVDERARKGMFLSFQYPEEVSGITNEYFIKKALMQRNSLLAGGLSFRKKLNDKVKDLALTEDYMQRDINVGFSGGEKKKNEILQMSMLKPKLAILDETDSGLDVDAIKVVYETVQKEISKDNAILIITHYSRILNYVDADYIHLLIDGKIVERGSLELAEKIDRDGYESFR